MEDKGPMTLGIIWTFAAVSGTFLGLRIYCKLARKRHLWWDDYVLIVAWICSVTAMSLESASIPYGMGKHAWLLQPHDLEMQMLLGSITTIFAMLASSLSKTSFAITLLRLVETSPLLKVILWFIIVTLNGFYVANILYSWFRCSPSQKLWSFTVEGTCSDVTIYVNYSLFVAGYSAFLDFVLAFLPTLLIRNLQMKLKEKIGVAIAMGMGVFGGITAAVKAYQLGTFASPDTSYELVSPLIWGAAEATVTIIAASIPVLRVLIKDHVDSRRKYYEQDYDGGSGGTAERKHVQPPAPLQVDVMTKVQGPSLANIREESSHESLTFGEAVTQPIVQTNEVRVEYKRGPSRYGDSFYDST